MAADKSSSGPHDATDQYLDDVALLDATQAIEELVSWVKDGYATMDTESKNPLFGLVGYSSPRFVSPNSSVYEKLITQPSLRSWIYVASHRPEIARFFGESQTPGDYSFNRLALETVLTFFNDLRDRYDTFDEATIREQARAFWDELASETQTYEVGGIVVGLSGQSQRDSFALGPDLELHRLATPWGAERFTDTHDVASDKWAMAATITRRRREYGAMPELDPEGLDKAALDWGLLPFRLTHHQCFVFTDYRRGLIADRRLRLMGTVRAPLDLVTFGEPLTENGMEYIASLGGVLEKRLHSLQRLCDATVEDSLDLAIQRFQSAFERQEWHDKVLDLTIALEALLAGETTAEISHKASMRAALLVGRNEDDSKRLKDSARDLYGIRSDIAHGNTVQGVKNAKKLINSWGLPPASNPGGQAGQLATRLVAEVLRAIVWLDNKLTPSPVGTIKQREKFLDRLDKSSLDPKDRKTIQELASLHGGTVTRVGGLTESEASTNP